MTHIRQLETKISEMEARHRQRESDLQSLIDKTRSSASTTYSSMVAKYLFRFKKFFLKNFDKRRYNNIIQKKNTEINAFRAELDNMLQTIAAINNVNSKNGVVYVSNVE